MKRRDFLKLGAGVSGLLSLPGFAIPGKAIELTPERARGLGLTNLPPEFAEPPRPDRGVKRTLLPMPVLDLGPGDSGTVVVNPQAPFRPTQLVLDRAVGCDGLMVTNIYVGVNSQFIGPGAIPARAFLQGNPEGLVHWDTAVPGLDITIEFHNGSKAPVKIISAFFGLTIE